MKSQRKRTREKKQRQANMSDNMAMSGGSTDDVIIISSGDSMIDLGNHTNLPGSYTIGNIDTITLDSSVLGSNFNVGNGALSWSSTDYAVNSYSCSPNVNISNTGVNMKDDCDLKIGDRSLKDFMDRVEDRLAILHPNEELEERWEQLKDLRRQYEALEKDILEKEKIMKILKEQ